MQSLSLDIAWHIFHTEFSSRQVTGAIFNLKCSNINFDNSIIYLFDTKTQANKVIPLNKIACYVAKKYYTSHGNWLFQNSKDAKLERVGKPFRQTATLSGLNDGITDRRQKIVFHSLWHTFASWLVQQQVELEVVSKLLGHKSLHMALRYAHLTLDSQRSAVAALENIQSSYTQ